MRVPVKKLQPEPSRLPYLYPSVRFYIYVRPGAPDNITTHNIYARNGYTPEAESWKSKARYWAPHQVHTAAHVLFGMNAQSGEGYPLEDAADEVENVLSRTFTFKEDTALSRSIAIETFPEHIIVTAHS